MYGKLSEFSIYEGDFVEVACRYFRVMNVEELLTVVPRKKRWKYLKYRQELETDGTYWTIVQ